MQEQLIKISTLPKSVQQSLPMSIRTYKDEYYLDELPPQVQFLLRDYTINNQDIKYKIVYDIRPEISEYGDFDTLKTVKETTLEYLKNYFLTLPGDYPFDPLFGCNLKKNLQTRDSELRKTLISSEIDSIVNVLSADLGVKITINNVSINNLNKGDRVEYVVSIDLTINDEGATIGMNV